MSINQIVTPLDSAVLETREQYEVYFKLVTHAFNELVDSLHEKDICSDQEITYLKQYCELLVYSLEAFRIKYLYDEEEKMKIDLTESGYPNYLEFRYLINDLALRNEHIKKLPPVESLKNDFLESLLKYKEPIAKDKLQKAASIVYYTTVEERLIFKRFVQGKVIDINTKEAQYLTSWSFYDVTYNRPFICFLYFDLYKEKLEDYKEKIYGVLETVADRKMPADMMAFAIDKKLSKMWPKRLRIVDLGPLHTIFAKDELVVTHALLKAMSNKTLDLSAYAMSFTIDEAQSVGTIEEGGFFSTTYLQNWEVKRPKKYVFTSHRVIQLLYDNIPEHINTLTEDPIEIAALTL